LFILSDFNVIGSSVLDIERMLDFAAFLNHLKIKLTGMVDVVDVDSDISNIGGLVITFELERERAAGGHLAVEQVAGVFF
jgi:hypothetical protein